MPYQIVFAKNVQVSHVDEYVNPCCWGGDVVARRLLPVVEERYRDIQCNQEDWGWFIWFRDGALSLAIDIFCDDATTGEFRIHLTSKLRRWVSSRVVDGPELEWLKSSVVSQLSEWPVADLATARLDSQYRQVEQA